MEEEKRKSNILVLVLVGIIVILGGFLFFGGDGVKEEVIEEEVIKETSAEVKAPQPPSRPITVNRNTTREGTEIPPTDALTVSYTSNGFSPFTLEVNAGDTVNFVNNSSGTMWIASIDNTETKIYYPEFRMSKSIGTGETYVFQFTRTGAWGYENLNNEKHRGAIIVIPQKLQ